MGSTSSDFVYQVFNAGNAELAQLLFNHGVLSDGDSLAVHLSETSLQDQLRNGLSVWVTVNKRKDEQVKSDSEIELNAVSNE